MNHQQTQNAMTTQKKRWLIVYFKDVLENEKTEETLNRRQDQKSHELVETTQFVTTFFFGQKSTQRKSASATIANPMNTSRI